MKPPPSPPRAIRPVCLALAMGLGGLLAASAGPANTPPRNGLLRVSPAGVAGQAMAGDGREIVLTSDPLFIVPQTSSLRLRYRSSKDTLLTLESARDGHTARMGEISLRAAEDWVELTADLEADPGPQAILGTTPPGAGVEIAWIQFEAQPLVLPTLPGDGEPMMLANSFPAELRMLVAHPLKALRAIDPSRDIEPEREPIGSTRVIPLTAIESSGKDLARLDREGTPYLSGLRDRSWLRFTDSEVGAPRILRLRFASDDGGGQIEVHYGEMENRPVAIVPIPPTGGWQTWETMEIELPAAEAPVAQTYLVFRSAENRFRNSLPDRFNPSLLSSAVHSTVVNLAGFEVAPVLPEEGAVVMQNP